METVPICLSLGSIGAYSDYPIYQRRQRGFCTQKASCGGGHNKSMNQKSELFLASCFLPPPGDPQNFSSKSQNPKKNHLPNLARGQKYAHSRARRKPYTTCTTLFLRNPHTPYIFSKRAKKCTQKNFSLVKFFLVSPARTASILNR